MSKSLDTRADCTFADLEGQRIIEVAPGSKVSLKNCEFDSNTLYESADASAIIRMEFPNLPDGAPQGAVSTATATKPCDCFGCVSFTPFSSTAILFV